MVLVFKDMRWNEYGLIITWVAGLGFLGRGVWHTRKPGTRWQAWAVMAVLLMFWPPILLSWVAWQSRNMVSDQLDPYVGALWNENGEADPKEVDIWIKKR
jgi:hypothetical protein